MREATGRVGTGVARQSLVLPRLLLELAIRCLDRVARGLIALGATANVVTASCLVLGAVAGSLLCFGHFGWAALAMVMASLGDALDGLIARRTGSASVGGALLDASVDRYEEFFWLGGLAVYFHHFIGVLVLVLAAMAGSFMVSYGSAKAEALGVPAPPGVMRRAERAVLLCAGVALTPLLAWATRASPLPWWSTDAPVLGALTVLSVAANVSAVRRLRYLAAARASTEIARPVVLSLETRPPELGVGSDSDGHVVAAATHAFRAP